MVRANLLFVSAVLAAAAWAEDWPTVRHDIARTGYTPDCIRPPVNLRWKRSFENGPIATCVEPIVAEGKVYVSSMNGTLYAVHARDGRDAWAFTTQGPLVNSPAYANGKLYVGSIDGHLYCLDGATGALRWKFDGGRGGFAASPTIEGNVIYIGSRGGTFFAVRDEGSRPSVAWRYEAGAPIWQTAALGKGRLYFMAENMVAHALRKEHGIHWWASRQVGGCRARDSYACFLGEHVVFRTSPADGVQSVVKEGGAALLRGGSFTGKNEVVISRLVDALKPWEPPDYIVEGEGRVVDSFLAQTRPEHQTFHILTADDGNEVPTPILWTGGCGGVCGPPAVAADRSVFVPWRSLFTGWIEAGSTAVFGQAPRHGLGKLTVGTGRVSRFDPVPPGKLPWGVFLVANEANAFQVGGDLLYIVHQGAVSAFDLTTRKSAVLLGVRDLWGGEPALGWAANEWRGPARAGMAISGTRAYWIVGSYLLALEERGK